MFTVYDKKTNKEVKVYDVKRDKSDNILFLVEIDGQWRYRWSEYYTSSLPDISDKDVDMMLEDIVSRNKFYENEPIPLSRIQRLTLFKK